MTRAPEKLSIANWKQNVWGRRHYAYTSQGEGQMLTRRYTTCEGCSFVLVAQIEEPKNMEDASSCKQNIWGPLEIKQFACQMSFHRKLKRTTLSMCMQGRGFAYSNRWIHPSMLHFFIKYSQMNNTLCTYPHIHPYVILLLFMCECVCERNDRKWYDRKLDRLVICSAQTNRNVAHDVFVCTIFVLSSIQHHVIMIIERLNAGTGLACAEK